MLFLLPFLRRLPGLWCGVGCGLLCQSTSSQPNGIPRPGGPSAKGRYELTDSAGDWDPWHRPGSLEAGWGFSGGCCLTPSRIKMKCELLCQWMDSGPGGRALTSWPPHPDPLPGAGWQRGPSGAGSRVGRALQGRGAGQVVSLRPQRALSWGCVGPNQRPKSKSLASFPVA